MHDRYARVLFQGAHDVSYQSEVSKIPTTAWSNGTHMIVWYFSVREFLGDSWDCNNASVAIAPVSGPSAWNFHLQPELVWTKGSSFQMFAVVHCQECPLAGDGYIYIMGTPCGREGSAYLARVNEENILDQSSWQYFHNADTHHSQDASMWSSNISLATVVLKGGVGELSVRGCQVFSLPTRASNRARHECHLVACRAKCATNQNIFILLHICLIYVCV